MRADALLAVANYQGAVDLFLSLTQIAGVSVGFRALIAVRSGGTMEVSEVNSIRWVVTTGIWVVITALAPPIVSNYGLTGHELWLVCSLLALALLAVMIVVFARTPENLAELEVNLAITPRLVTALVMGPRFWLPAASLVSHGGLARPAHGRARPVRRCLLAATPIVVG
jgi:Na+/melibiose symporter-like transporter